MVSRASKLFQYENTIDDDFHGRPEFPTSQAIPRPHVLIRPCRLPQTHFSPPPPTGNSLSALRSRLVCDAKDTPRINFGNETKFWTEARTTIASASSNLATQTSFLFRTRCFPRTYFGWIRQRRPRVADQPHWSPRSIRFCTESRP